MSYVDQYAAGRNPHYLGRGRVWFTPPLLPTGGVNTVAYGRRWGTNWPQVPDVPGQLRMAPGRFVGNGRSLSVETAIRHLDTSAWDPRGNTVVDSVSASVMLYGHGAVNLVDALHGLRQQHAAMPMTETIRTGMANIDAGGMLFLRHLVDANKTISVAPSWATWSEGVHYRREAFGIQLLAGMSGPAGSSIAISYTPEGSAETIDAMVDKSLEIGIVYTGINAIDGRAVRTEIFRARPVIEGGLQPLTDGAGVVTLNFSIQPVRSAESRSAEWFRTTHGQYPTEI